MRDFQDVVGMLFYFVVVILATIAASFMVFFIGYKVIEQTVGF